MKKFYFIGTIVLILGLAQYFLTKENIPIAPTSSGKVVNAYPTTDSSGTVTSISNYKGYAIDERGYFGRIITGNVSSLRYENERYFIGDADAA